MTKRVLTGQIKHETNTFSNLPTTLDSYRARVLYECERVLSRLEGSNNALEVWMAWGAEEGWELGDPSDVDARQ